MVKRSAPIQEVARLLDLVPYISTHSHISLKELAAEFGVTEKAMADELTSLSMCGLPGYTPYELIEVYFDSGFVTINNHETLDIPRALTNVEVASLLIGLGLLRESAHGEERLMSAIDLLSEKLSTQIDPIVDFEKVEEGPELSRIQRAIAERRQITFHYQSPVRDEIDVRQVAPLSLYSENGKIYLGGFSYDASAYRIFRIDRMSEISIGEISSQNVPTFSAEAEPEFEAELHVTHRRRSIAEALSVEEVPTSGTLTYRSYSSQWVERTAVAFSPDLTISEPAESRAHVREQLEKILALYRS